jgi:DNA repair exonuclease SbcCD nuclease subunit
MIQRETEIRIILVSDTHLGFDLPRNPRIAEEHRGEDFFENFAAVLRYAREKNADFVVHGGDLFFRSRLAQGVINRVYRMLHDYAGKGRTILIIPGNHERSVLPPSLFINDPDIHIFHRPVTFRFNVRGQNIGFSGFPYTPGDIRSGFINLLHETGWKKTAAGTDFLCVHQIVEGATVGPAEYRFNGSPQTIAIGDIPPEFTAVLAGHIHRAQIIFGRDRIFHGRLPVVFGGSVERTSMAERNELKGFYDIRIRLNDAGGILYESYDFVPLPARPVAEIFLPREMTVEWIRGFIEDRIRDIDPRSIVYISCDPDYPLGTKINFTGQLLRGILPSGMIGKIGRSCFSR